MLLTLTPYIQSFNFKGPSPVRSLIHMGKFRSHLGINARTTAQADQSLSLVRRILFPAYARLSEYYVPFLRKGRSYSKGGSLFRPQNNEHERTTAMMQACVNTDRVYRPPVSFFQTMESHSLLTHGKIMYKRIRQLIGHRRTPEMSPLCFC